MREPVSRIGFVFTNYNNSKFTGDAVRSISLNQFSGEYYIAVVDNKSTQEEIDLLNEIKHEFPFINVIFNNENAGYFRGLNIGIKYLRENYQDLDYIIIGNNDLLFPADFIRTVCENDEVFEKYPVISPDLITLDGLHQNPHVVKEISKFRELIYDIYHSSFRMALLVNLAAKVSRKVTDRKDEEQHEVAQTIYQGYGACYILGPVFFKYFDQLWAPSFLMGEEFFLSKQLEEKNMKVFYEPRIKVVHQEHASVGKIPRKKLWEFSRESHRIYRKYVGVWK